MNYLELPVYQHKTMILSALQTNQVIVVESPTGSGKTTQLPVILYEAGYGDSGMIGVTQPRRIAAVSVSEYIARQMGTVIPGVVGYKMRFDDHTDPHTKIKIMTDGILLQEMKLDPWLSKYDVIVVDEAHERSLNIDFILGLLKRVLVSRKEFKVIISSATINTQVFSNYFNGCPVLKIDATIYPVTMIYDPIRKEKTPQNPWDYDAREIRQNTEDALIEKVCTIVQRIVTEDSQGDILIFLSGEKLIKKCLLELDSGPCSQQLYLIPLYGRLSKEEQDRVFDPAPAGKTKIVISTNIAETSVTIDGITAVIDSGLSKLNYYNPETHTSSLVEAPISRASADQRKGRAGRTRPGVCYRLYPRKDFERRYQFTREEIYRTDLSEVILRMSDLGILDFEDFDFISPPNRQWLIAALETLELLDALEPDRTLSKIGKMMTEFPLDPRQSRIIVEAILKYPDVIQESVIAAAFLSTQSPYLLPLGEEMQARHAHAQFRDAQGDFISYLIVYNSYQAAANKSDFCRTFYLDDRVMAEISNVVVQLEEIVSRLEVPITSGGTVENYLSTIARAFIQFVGVTDDFYEGYRTLTAEGIVIHPGSVLFRENPQFIVAGEIVETSRLFAMSVSPLTEKIIKNISPDLLYKLRPEKKKLKRKTKGKQPQEKKAKAKIPEQRPEELINITIAGIIFEFVDQNHTKKGKKKKVLLPWERLAPIKKDLEPYKGKWPNLRGVITCGEKRILDGEKLDLIFSLAPELDLESALNKKRIPGKHYLIAKKVPEVVSWLPEVMTPVLLRSTIKTFSFVSFHCDNDGRFWFGNTIKFHQALTESLASLSTLIDTLKEDPGEEAKQIINQTYRRISDLIH